MKKYLSLFTYIIILISCTSSTQEKYSEPKFKNIVTVSPVIINTTKPAGEIRDIQVHKNYLLYKSFDGSNLIQVFNKTNGDFVAGLAPSGRGPGEYSMTVSFYFIGDTLCIYDRKLCIMNYYRNDFLTNFTPFKKTKLRGVNGFFQVVPYKGGFISIPTIKSRFMVQDSLGNLINIYSHYPVFNKIKDSSILKKVLYTGRHEINIKPDCTKLVSATFMGAIIEIFTLNGNKISPYKEIRILPPTFLFKNNNDVTMSDNSYVGFWNVKTTEKYIYTIFYGGKLKDFKKTRNGNYIYVFDWEGRPVKKYIVNGGVNRFAIDEKNNRAYIIRKNLEGEDKLAYFDL